MSHAGLLNHACEDPSCAATWLWLPQCTLPIMVCTTRRSLRRGSELTYNYDAHNPTGAFTVGPEEAASLAPLGLTYGPCRCRHPAECPPSAFYPSTIITMPLAPSYNRSPPHAGLNNIPSQSRPFAMAVRHNT